MANKEFVGAVKDAISNPKVFSNPGTGRSSIGQHTWANFTLAFVTVVGDEMVVGPYTDLAEEIRGSGYLAPEITQVVVLEPGSISMKAPARFIIMEGASTRIG